MLILCLMTCGNALLRCFLLARHGVAATRDDTRWVVEHTFAWLHQFKRLRIRYEIRADLHLGLLQLACSIICLRRLRTSF